jgi:hypothetical protein
MKGRIWQRPIKDNSYPVRLYRGTGFNRRIVKWNGLDQEIQVIHRIVAQNITGKNGGIRFRIPGDQRMEEGRVNSCINRFFPA